MTNEMIFHLLAAIVCFYLSILFMFLWIGKRISAIKQRLECMCCHLCDYANNEEDENENDN